MRDSLSIATILIAFVGVVAVESDMSMMTLSELASLDTS